MINSQEKNAFIKTLDGIRLSISFYFILFEINKWSKKIIILCECYNK